MWFHIYEVQEQAILVDGDRNEKSSCLSGQERGYEEFQGDGEVPYLDLSSVYIAAHIVKAHQTLISMQLRDYKLYLKKQTVLGRVNLKNNRFHLS